MYKIIKHSWPNELQETVDLAFADPPYNYGVKYDGDDTGDAYGVEHYRTWVHQTVSAIANTVKVGGMLFWLCPAEDGRWTWEHLERFGSLLYGIPIIWHERFSQYQKKRLTKDYRLLFPIVVGADKVKTFNPDEIREESERQRMKDKRADPAGRVPGHVWQVRRLQGTAKARVDWHPAQLPPEPLERIVNGWTNPGDVVLDAFAGSGSMALAAIGNDRHFIGTENSQKYCDEIRKRLEGNV